MDFCLRCGQEVKTSRRYFRHVCNDCLKILRIINSSVKGWGLISIESFKGDKPSTLENTIYLMGMFPQSRTPKHKDDKILIAM